MEVIRLRRGVVLRSAWKMGRGYFFSESKKEAWLLLLIVISLNLFLVYITVELNIWQGNFYQVLQLKDHRGFLEAIAIYAGLAVILIVVKGAQTYFRLLLQINWRRWLTKEYLRRWLDRKSYYRLQFVHKDYADNPDQRISEDVDLFVSLTLRLSLDCLHDMITVISFVVILWNLSGLLVVAIFGYTFMIQGYMVWAAFIYAIFGTYFTVKFGKPLIQLDYDKQKYEADFRYSLIRVREYSESIALYGGELAEEKNCLAHFTYLVQNFRQIIQVRKQLMWLTTAYAHIAVVFAVAAASPRYFAGKIQLGQLFQITDAFYHVQNGLSFIIDSFTKVAHWRAVVNRLNGFLVSMEELDIKMISPSRGECKIGSDIHLSQVSIYKPDKIVLIKGLKLHLPKSKSLIVTGASGCGKSTLVKTLAGLWKNYDGNVSIPNPRESLFVPQKPYMPIDTLRNALFYPDIKRKITDEEIGSLLERCCLPSFKNRLNEFGDWGKILSLGEQQRIAFVRILIHQPKWLFLDEATSALDEVNQEIMYGLVKKFLPDTAIISVGHRQSIMRYHQLCLNIEKDTSWSLKAVKI